MFAQSWADTELKAADFDHFAGRLHGTGLDEAALQHILEHEVCGGFALYSLGTLISAGMALPPYFFPADEARERIQSWLARPRWQSRLNPLWWLGLWTARWMVRQDWAAIRSRLAEARCD